MREHNSKSNSRQPLKGTFTAMPDKIIRSPIFHKLPAGCPQLYCFIRSFKWQNEYSWPGIKLMAEVQGVHRNTIGKRLKILEQAGLITRKKVFGKPDLISFPIPEIATSGDDSPTHSITSMQKPRVIAAFSVPKQSQGPAGSRSLPPAKIVQPNAHTGSATDAQLECVEIIRKEKDTYNQINVANHSDLDGLGGGQQLIDLGDFKPLQIESPIQTVAKTATVDFAPVVTDLSDYKSFLSSKFDRQKVTDKLLDLIDDDFKANAKNAITTLHNQKNHLALFPVSLCRYLRDNASRINNKSAYVWGALRDPEKYDMIITAASQLDTAWRIEFADTKYLKRQQDHWRSISLNNTPYSAEELEEKTRFHAKLRADIAAKAGKLDMFDKDGKLDMRTPRPRGLTEREWCQQNGWDWNAWYKANHDGREYADDMKKLDELTRKAGGQVFVKSEPEPNPFASLGMGV